MKEAVLARQELDDGAEVEQALDRAFVDLADFDLGRDDLDAAAGSSTRAVSGLAMVTVPSSSMLIVVPVSSVRARMVAPPCR